MYLMNSIFITFSLDICQFQNIAEMCWTYNIWIKGDKETLNKIIKIKKGQIDKNKSIWQQTKLKPYPTLSTEHR